MSGHYYFVEKLNIVEEQLCKLYCSYGKVSHALKTISLPVDINSDLDQIFPLYLRLTSLIKCK